MKQLINLFLLSLVAGASACGQSAAPNSTAPAADSVMNEAKIKAAKEHKNVFLMFHASWCTWCHKMDVSMNDPSCADYFRKNYVIVHLVVDEQKEKKHLENPGAAELKTKYHGDGQGIPFWLVFDKDGNLLGDSKMRSEGQGPDEGQNTGCPAAEPEVAHFISVLKKSSTLTPEQEEKIRVRFRKNDM